MNLKQVFRKNLKHLKFDRRLAKEIRGYTSGFINKNPDHTSFFGNTLVGTPRIRFLPEDSSNWFENVLDVDFVELRNDIHSLDTIDPSFNVASDTFNLSILYLAYEFNNTKDLSPKDREDVVSSLFVLLYAKFLSSLMYNNFKLGEADRDIAVAAYAAMSRRFILKQYGSWIAYFRGRAETLMEPSSKAHPVLTKFDDDDTITDLLSSIQTKLRASVNEMVTEFHNVRKQDARIRSSSSYSVLDGEEVILDRVDNKTRMIQSLKTAANEYNSLIKEDLVEVVIGIMKVLKPDQLEDALRFMVDNYGQRRAEYIETLIQDTVIHAIGFARTNNYKLNNLRELVPKLRNVYMSPKTSDELLLGMREMSDKIVTASVRSKSPTVLSAGRTGLILYLALRALTAEKFD